MRRPIVAFALWNLIMPHIVAAQPCDASVSDLSHTATLSVKNSSKTCTAADGDYIKTNSTYKLHVSAAVEGSCQTYVWDGQCVPAYLYKHTAVRSDLSVTSHPSTLTVLGGLNVQSYNTCAGDNCIPVNTLQNGSSWMAPTPAVYVYTAMNVAGGGTSGSGGHYCNMTHSYPSNNSVTLHALTCVPQWELDGTKLVHLPNFTTANVYVPPSVQGTPLDLAVQAAIAGWNNANAGNGVAVTLARTTDECNGPGCIRIGALNTGSDCAVINIPPTDAAGVPSGTVNITVHSSYTSQEYYANGSLTQRMSHELGHLFGLTQSGCTAAQSVMAQPASCGAAQALQTPSYTDSHPVANTTYGGGSRNSCQ